MKVKVTSGLTKKDGDKIHLIQLNKAKLLYQSFPMATKTWMAMRGFPMEWLKNHWQEIIS